MLLEFIKKFLSPPGIHPSTLSDVFHKVKPSPESHDSASIVSLPTIGLADNTDGKPVLFIGYYCPDQQKDPDDAIFSNLRFYTNKYYMSGIKIFTKLVWVKGNRKIADSLIAKAPSRKRYKMLIAAYPCTFKDKTTGTLCGMLSPAYDVTKHPLMFPNGKPLIPPDDLIEKCFHPDLNQYLTRGAHLIREPRKKSAETVDPALITESISTIPAEFGNLHASEIFLMYKAGVPVSVLNVALAAKERPIAIYGSFSCKQAAPSDTNYFGNIKLYSPQYPYTSIRRLIKKLKVYSEEHDYSFWKIKRKVLEFGGRVVLIGYLQLYAEDRFIRCKFRLANITGNGAIFYQCDKSLSKIRVPNSILEKCYLPDISPFLKETTASEAHTKGRPSI